MSRKKYLLILWIAVVTACSSPQLLPDAKPEARMMYRDDFSSSSSTWTTYQSSEGTSGYADGVYLLTADAPYSNITSAPGLSLNDVRVEVDAIRVGGDRNNRFGIICRMSGQDRYYAFLISSDGYYGIGKVIGTAYQLLEADTMLPSDKIPVGTSYIQLRADCIKDRLGLYVNGELVHEARDSGFTGGDVGLIVGTYEQPGAQIIFDNFVVYKP